MKIKFFILSIIYTLATLFTTFYFPAYASEKTNKPGVQNGVQTYDMTIDEGLEILGYDPRNYQTFNILDYYEHLDLKEYFGDGLIDLDVTPIEVLGITESYEFVDTQNYIDTYVYIYTPYCINLTDTELGTMVPLTSYANAKAIMFQMNEDKMNVGENNDGWWLNLYGYSNLEHDMQDYSSLARSYITSEEESNSVSSGVTRLRIRVYTKADLNKIRNYYVEKLIFKYHDYATDTLVSSYVTPSFNTKFSVIDKNGNVDVEVGVDDEFTDSNIWKPKDTDKYNVKWAEGNVKYWTYRFKPTINPLTWGYLWDDMTVAYIRITDNNDKLLDNVTHLECKYEVDGKVYHVDEDINLTYLDKSGFISLGEYGLFTSYDYYWDKVSVSTTVFKHDKLAKIFDGSDGSEVYKKCNYIWQWGENVTNIQYLYVWYLDPVTGEENALSFYEDGLHPLYNEKGDLLGVYDKDGNLVDKYTLSNNGLIADSNTKEEIDLIGDQLGGESSNGKKLGNFLDEIEDYFGGLFGGIEDKVVKPIKIISLLIGIVGLIFISKWIIDIIEKISNIRSNSRK